MRTCTRSDWRDYLRMAWPALVALAGVLCLLTAAACRPRPLPPLDPPAPPPATIETAVTIRGVGGFALDTASATLTIDDADGVPSVALIAHGWRPVFGIPIGHRGHGAALVVSAPNYTSLERRLTLPLQSGELLPGEEIALTPRPTLERLSMRGRLGLFRPDGQHVVGTSVTGFQFVELVAHGRQAEAAAFLQAVKPAKFVRVLLMAAHLFTLAPAEGVAALPAALDLAAQHGTYLEVTIFADTKSYPGIDYRGIADQVGAICAEKPACAVVELGNELHELHQTQADALGDLSRLRSLRDTIRRHGEIPVSLGSTHAGQDESDRFEDGDYLTVHGDRSEEGDGAWRPVRHTNEQRALADRLRTYVWNDEPARKHMACDWQLGMGLLARLFRLGDTFHFQNGLFALPPEGLEKQGFDCRARAWTLIPEDWYGQYFNAGFAGSPVKSFSNALRAYSSVNGSTGYTLVLDARGITTVEWNWPVRTLVLWENGVQLWRVAR